VIVIDAAATVDLLLGTSRGAAVRRAIAAEFELHAPDLVDPEVLSAIRRWLLRGVISPARANRAVDELGELPLTRFPHSPLRARVWALRNRCSAYDGLYIALAQALDARFLTTDARLSKTAQGLIHVLDVRP
jgi:predicted nucleic acid-binding protein